MIIIYNYNVLNNFIKNYHESIGNFREKKVIRNMTKNHQKLIGIFQRKKN